MTLAFATRTYLLAHNIRLSSASNKKFATKPRLFVLDVALPKERIAIFLLLQYLHYDSGLLQWMNMESQSFHIPHHPSPISLSMAYGAMDKVVGPKICHRIFFAY